MESNKNIKIIQDNNGRSIVLIKGIIFKGRQNIAWNDVEKYLKQHIGKFIKMTASDDIIYFGSDLPDEYAGSNYTVKLKGAYAKAKANVAQGILEITKTAEHKRFQKKLSEKHHKNAKFGWYRYDAKFAIPVFDDNGSAVKYNIFHAELIVRHASDGKKYLYDMINIKKETSTPL